MFVFIYIALANGTMKCDHIKWLKTFTSDNIKQLSLYMTMLRWQFDNFHHVYLRSNKISSFKMICNVSYIFDNSMLPYERLLNSHLRLELNATFMKPVLHRFCFYELALLAIAFQTHVLKLSNYSNIKILA